MAFDVERKVHMSTNQESDRAARDTNYTIEQVKRLGQHLVMKILHPSSTYNYFDSCRVMVWLFVREEEALLWRSIPRGFRAPVGHQSGIPLTPDLGLARNPDAIFPPTEKGWKNAIEFASSRVCVQSGSQDKEPEPSVQGLNLKS